jgi:apolipoprotein N-acyltransferase
VAPDGEVLGQLPLNVEGRLDLAIPLRDWTPPYRHVGEAFAMVASALALALGGLALRGRAAIPGRGPSEDA